eukprot:GGOE01023061.1.p1 GENE.GGOE01023061.1~~GGOE01023061.1.p1  ORF type:complete len:417 (+),score=72.77 GGOE01023061.1:95-1345(+)
MARLVWALIAVATIFCVGWLGNTLRPYKAGDEKPPLVERRTSQGAADVPQPLVQQAPELPAATSAVDPARAWPTAQERVPRVQVEQEERFLFVCVQYGRHNNQLISLAKSYSLAYHSNRTLVLPQMYKKHPHDESTRPAEQFYDLSSGPVRVRTSAEFQALWGNHSEVMCVDGARRCTYTRGHIPCASLTPLPFPDGRRNVEHVQAGPQLVVTGGENTFFANVPHSPCMYRWLKLQPKYEAEVRRAQLALKLPTDYFGLHVRWMENKCRWALGKAHARAYEKHNLPKPDFLQDIFPMCQMQPNYYRKFWNHTGNFFVAHDHQSDAAFYRKLVRDGAVFYASFKGFSALQGDEAMLLDFWLLVGAKVFVGNAMSTLSMNVCGVRTALGRQCDNMQLMAKMYPCFLHPDFDKAFNVTT